MADGGVPVGLRRTLHERTPPGVRFVFGATNGVGRGNPGRNASFRAGRDRPEPVSCVFIPKPLPAMPELDATRLLSTLRTELRAAWAEIRAAHAQERLYGFGAYTTDVASYLTVTAFSEAGLDQVAARYQADKQFGGGELASQRESLRWSPCDSPLHLVGGGHLEQSNKIVQILDAIEAECDAAAGDESDEGVDFDDDDEDLDESDDFEGDGQGDAFDASVDEVFRVVVLALQEMDREGLFGVGAERDRFVLCLWKGDQSNIERHEFAKALNPPAVARRFGEELNAGVRAFYRLHMPEDVPEDDVFE